MTPIALSQISLDCSGSAGSPITIGGLRLYDSALSAGDGPRDVDALWLTTLGVLVESGDIRLLLAIGSPVRGMIFKDEVTAQALCGGTGVSDMMRSESSSLIDRAKRRAGRPRKSGPGDQPANTPA